MVAPRTGGRTSTPGGQVGVRNQASATLLARASVEVDVLKRIREYQCREDNLQEDGAEGRVYRYIDLTCSQLNDHTVLESLTPLPQHKVAARPYS